MKVWVVVHVWKDVETEVFLFKNEEDAQKKYESLYTNEAEDTKYITEEEVK